MDHRHSKRNHSSPSSLRRELPTRSMINNDGENNLSTVKEEDGGVDGTPDTTFALTSKHLLATTDFRLSFHGTKDLSAYKTLCQQKKSLAMVPSPYHAMDSIVVQVVKPASMSSGICSEDTGYKSASFGSHEMHARHRKSTDVQTTKHRERVEPIHRIQTQNPRPPSDPTALAALLIEKLEQVRRDQSFSQDKPIHYRSREDLEKEDAQSILDDHISRVFGDSSGELSPRERVSSWVLDAKKYYDLKLEDGKFTSHRNTTAGNNGLLVLHRMDTSDGVDIVRQHRRMNGCSHGFGSIDEGLGRSITSLENAATSMSDEHSRKNVAQSSHTASEQKELTKFSNWFTLKPSKKFPPNVSSQVTGNPRETISVVYQIVGEELPYLSKVPGSQLTLRQFKSLIPRKGKYRYFFKRMCEELDVGAVFEEIVDDNETLPFWEGKISSRLEPIVD